MAVREAIAFLGILFLSVSPLHAARPVEADPHELYESARDHLKNGELGPAEQALSRLRTLVSRGSEWDPDGTFAHHLLPPLQARLKRMQAVTRELDAFSARALQGLKPPDAPDDLAPVQHLTQWAASVVQRLRRERDRIITEGLQDPEEQAALTLTASYARTERLLETDVMRSIVDSAGDEFRGLVSGDPRVDAVLVRFRQLKQDLMRIMAERNSLEQEVKKSRTIEQAQLAALAALVTEGNPGASAKNASDPLAVSDSFAQFLDQERAAVGRRSSQTTAQRDVSRAALERYRRYNDILSRSGIAADQSERIQALTRGVESLRVDDRVLSTSSIVAWALGMLSVALALIAGFAMRVAVSRGKQLSSAGSKEPSRSWGPGRTVRRDIDGHAA